MNEYNYDYQNYMNNISDRNYQYEMNNISDRNYKYDMMPNYMKNIPNSINYIPNMDNAQIKMMEKNTQILEPYQGYIRGNLFANLYDPYKNYKPSEINSTNEKESLLYQWQQYNFALTDLDLYLDVHPNDSKALNLYNKYLSIKKQITDKYESMYGPLTLGSNDLGNNTWKWVDNPWPWEGDK